MVWGIISKRKWLTRVVSERTGGLNFSSKGVGSGITEVREVLSIKRGFTAKENNNDGETRILMAVMIKYYHDRVLPYGNLAI